MARREDTVRCQMRSGGILHERFEAKLNQLGHEFLTHHAMPFPAFAQAFFFDDSEALVHGIVQGRRRRVVIDMGLFEILGQQTEIEIPSGRIVLAFSSHSQARGEMDMGESPAGQLKPFWAQL